MSSNRHGCKKWWIGITKNDCSALNGDDRSNCRYVAFSDRCTPTEVSHGALFVAVIGPFVTKRGALWAEKYGYNNPHFVDVNSAERLALIDKNNETRADGVSSVLVSGARRAK